MGIFLIYSRETSDAAVLVADQNEPTGSKSSGEDSDIEEIEVVKKYRTRTRKGSDDDEKVPEVMLDDIVPVPAATMRRVWWTDHVDAETVKFDQNLSGKLFLLFEIIRKCEIIGDKL